MIIIEIIPDCLGDPIRFACRFGNTFANTTGVIVSHDDPIGDATRYLLHISCTEAHINRVSDFVCSHDSLNRKPSSQTLAENRSAFCINAERCPLSGLSVEELLFPLAIDQLAADYFSIPPHWND
jgi:hypothetical protein